MFISRLGAALGKLFLALLNATLILIALCLWLGWMLFSEVNKTAETISSNIAAIAPLRENITGLTGEIAGLRGDLASACEGAATPETLAALRGRVQEFDAKLAQVSALTDEVAEDPRALIEHAVTVAVDRLGDQAQVLLNCRSAAPGARE